MKVDLDAGHGAVVGRAVPARARDYTRPRADGVGTTLTRRLRAMLSWSGPDTDPVTQLIRTHRGIHPDADSAILRRGYAIAESMHRGQMRKSGEPYITHPLAVAQILAELGMDTTTLVAALLHDTVEDTAYTLPALQDDFGAEVAHLVDGVTKFEKAFYGDSAEAETVRKMIIAAGRDVRVLIIKLADRLHNMRTLDARSPASRARIARATQEVLVPLCDRLGIQSLKRDLEDEVLLHLEPEAHARIDQYVTDRPGWTEYLDGVIAHARTALRREKVDAAVSPRSRHYYSIWKDTVAGDFPIPLDLPRIVVVIDGPDTDCYTALGAIHGLWRPVAGRFKDFIASPKNNLYRSLHTTVIGPQERTVEVLIRTEKMHRTAEYGIAAGYRFPRGGGEHCPEVAAEELTWLRRVLHWEQETTDAAQFVLSLRDDLADTEIQVFAQGQPVPLPAGSTPVDVAYALGEDIGNRCRGARVNNRMAPLSAPLSDGDVVEIFGWPDNHGAPDAAAVPGPREEWLGFVRSPQAHLQISNWFADRQEQGNSIPRKVRAGRTEVGRVLREHDRGLLNDDPLRRLAAEQGYPDAEALLVAVAEHRITPEEVVSQLIELVDRPQG